MNLHREGKYEGIIAARWKLKAALVCNSLQSHWAQTPSHSHLSFAPSAETLAASTGMEACQRASSVGTPHCYPEELLHDLHTDDERILFQYV